MTAERYYTTQSGAKYILPSDEAERERLELQHELLKREFSSVLLPSSLGLQSGDKVLDSGTGTGVWGLDVALSEPEGVSIVCCDIESRLFPLHSPANTSFLVCSVLSLPTGWSDTFTLVHQRLLSGALELDDWKAALRELYRVLKPGGWIRLEEVIPECTPPVDEHSATLPHTYRVWIAYKKLMRARGLVWDCAKQLPAWLEEAGFESVQTESQILWVGPGEACKAARQNFLHVWRGMKTPILAMGGLGLAKSEEGYEGHMRGMEAEWETNRLGYEFCGLTARKPTQTAK